MHYPVEEIPIAELNPDPKNAFAHSDAEIQRLVGVMGENGFLQPVVVNRPTMQIIGGHARVEAAKANGFDTVPAVMVDFDETKAKAVALSLNSPFGHWDDSQLEATLKELEEAGYDLDMTGLPPHDLEEILGSENSGFTDPDDVPEPPAEPITQRGDLIELGSHRLLCGDATSREDVDQLMGGKKADMVWTDPPYGIEIVSTATDEAGGGEAYKIPFGGVNNETLAQRKTRLGTVGGSKPFGSKKGTVGGDNPIVATPYSPVIGDDSTKTAIAAYELCASLNIPVLIFWGGNYYASALPDSSCWIVWDKENTGNFADCELAWTNQKTAVRLFRHMWNGLMKASERGEHRIHPTQKPVALAEWCFEKYGKESDLVLDLFAGSGTALIAAEKTKRTAYLMELSPEYCDVSIERWEAFTGKTAIRPERVAA